ncbi:MAG: type II secretion system F family protein [Planctomycetes bacterium]|nr:type II secretion system F family protein [Planctomycetota bacterium]MBU1518424.1 type II secretion system F family protein [Planctomycetota bacterium]
MATYEYSAHDETGHIFNGLYDDISNVAALRRELAKIGYNLVRAKRKRKFNPNLINVKQSEVTAFAFKFAGMCTAGLAIVPCLETLEKQTENRSLKYIITDIKRNVEIGLSLTESFEKYRDIFSDFFLGMIEAGESSGKLAESLEISARYLEKQADLKNRLKGALAYPIIVLLMCLVVVTALVIFVVPVFSKVYRQLGAALPGPTQAIIILSVILRRFWPALAAAVFSLPFLFRYIRKNPHIKTWWDYFKFKMPLFGRLNRIVAASSFVKTFAMLIMTGVPIIKALQVAGLVANNEKISYISMDIQKSVQSGSSLAESLKNHDIFPPLILQLADSGEQAGQLGQMLNKGAEFLDKDIDRTINSLMTKLEPALTLGMGVVIGLILLAVYMPMFDYMSHLK